MATNSFVTNDLGKQTSKTDSGGPTSYLFDGDRVFADSRADYTVGGVTGLISERASGVSRFYHADQLGSTRGLTNAAQTVTDSREYDAFGMAVATSGTTATPFGFVGGQGYQKDGDSGLMLLGARYYDPSLGRFISRDPIGDAGGLNLYGYCLNDPVNAVDGSGCARVEVRYNPLIAGAHHAYVIVVDNDGTTWYFRGGPSGGGPSSGSSGQISSGSGGSSSGSSSSGGSDSSGSSNSSSPGASPGGPGNYGHWGPISTDYGYYKPTSIDYTTEPVPTSVVVDDNKPARYYVDRLKKAMDEIEAGKTPYNPLRLTVMPLPERPSSGAASHHRSRPYGLPVGVPPFRGKQPKGI